MYLIIHFFFIIIYGVAAMGRCHALFCLAVFTLLGPVSNSVLAEDLAEEITAALERAGDNREQIQQALDRSPIEQRAGMRFLVAWMPERGSGESGCGEAAGKREPGLSGVERITLER